MKEPQQLISRPSKSAKSIAQMRFSSIPPARPRVIIRNPLIPNGSLELYPARTPMCVVYGTIYPSCLEEVNNNRRRSR